MREILFRGRTYGIKKWISGSLLIVYGTQNSVHYYINPDYGWPIYEEVDPETVGQYTGIMDQNGEKIFEGDIVRLTDEGGYRYAGMGVIEWLDKGEWYVQGIDINYDTSYKTHFPVSEIIYDTGFEVIGNIHEDPELLKEEEV